MTYLERSSKITAWGASLGASCRKRLSKTPDRQQVPTFRVSRRGFLQAAGVGAAGAALTGPAAVGAIPFHASRAAAQGSWDQEADIVVIGSGAAALSAAATAHSLGNSVIVLEKANVVGGTTGKSGGVYWIPNNSLMADFGLEDPKDAAIRYMARLAFPNLYNADDPHFGLPEHKYDLIEGFYDNGPTAVDVAWLHGRALRRRKSVVVRIMCRVLDCNS